MNQNKPVKLFGKKQIILIGLALCAGLGLFIHRSYEQKGYISGIDITSMMLTAITAIGIFSAMAWWANKPEKS